MAEPVLEEVTAGSSKVRDTSTLKPIDSSTVASAVEFEIINLLSVKEILELRSKVSNVNFTIHF